MEKKQEATAQLQAAGYYVTWLHDNDTEWGGPDAWKPPARPAHE